jgi:hypothetical protein
MEIIAGFLVCAFTGMFVLHPFKKGGIGFVLGLLLGPLGVAFALIERGNLRRAELNVQHRELIFLLRRIDTTPEPEMPWDKEKS